MSTDKTALEYVATTQVGQRGQLVIPKRIQEELALKAGTRWAVLRLGDGLILQPAQPRFEELCERMRSALVVAGLTQEDILATLPRARDRVYARHYRARLKSK
jgi:AbrB family looped-hinge helix DNA binding protein